MYRATDGIPRLINQVCDHAFLLASVGGHNRLSSEAIEEAWADLQQLPTLWSASTPPTAAGGVVEFGQLDDVADELPEAIPFRSAEAHSLHVAQTEEPSDADERAGQNPCEPQRALYGTEVDLDFPEFGNPLAEEFEEEEVVLDRYASDVEIFADVPRVTSWEGRRLASMLEPLDASTPHMPAESPLTFKFGPEEYTQPQNLGPISTSITDFVYPAPGETATTETAPLEGRAADVQSAEARAADVAARAIDRPIRPGPPTSFWAGASAASEDAELIIIENDVTPPAPQPPRKREYRQLFAKLRRG